MASLLFTQLKREYELKPEKLIPKFSASIFCVHALLLITQRVNIPVWFGNY